MILYRRFVGTTRFQTTAAETKRTSVHEGSKSPESVDPRSPYHHGTFISVLPSQKNWTRIGSSDGAINSLHSRLQQVSASAVSAGSTRPSSVTQRGPARRGHVLYGIPRDRRDSNLLPVLFEQVLEEPSSNVQRVNRILSMHFHCPKSPKGAGEV
ncbi:hypothetical protein B0H13DRAFT_2067525 [Mycena leptocephala]|nr:hypothetical protein B0H13DRAFT_2067525 [Mycena leptocephala]